MHDPVALFLLSIAGIFLIGSVGELIFQRTNIPDVIWLILAGILLGPVGGFITRPMLSSIAPYFAALTLVVVLFDGGSALKLHELRRAASRSSLLALSTFTFAFIGISALGAVFGLFSSRLHEWFGIARFLPEEWGLMHGVLLAAILGGSSSIIIMPAMAAAKVNAKVANLVNLESAVTDALCVVGTAAVVDIMLGTAAGSSPAVVFLKSFGIGAGIGIGAGLVWLFFLRALKDAQHAYPFTLAALLILYVIIDHSGGSAAFGILSVALILGNAKTIGAAIGLKDEVEQNMSVRGFPAQMAFIVKSLFFVFIGAMLGPPWGGVILGILLGVSLLLLRIPAVGLALIGSDVRRSERGLVNVAMPRGMAAGVLATLPVTRHVPGTEDFPVMVFTAVFVTILVFAVGFPLAKKKEAAGVALIKAGDAAEPIHLRPEASGGESQNPGTPPAPTAPLIIPLAGAEPLASEAPPVPETPEKSES
jgi:cell volume regulation protein A